MTLSQQIINLSTAEFWGIMLAAGGISLVAFYFAFRYFIRQRIIEDTPTAKIRSAHQGYLELDGSAVMMEGVPLIAPLTSTPCCWYRFKIEKRGDKNWRTIESDTSDSLFQIRDNTGLCHIDPEGADVTPTDRSVWYGSSRYPHNRQPVTQRTTSGMAKLAGLLTTDISLGSRYRYTEERIYDGDPLYAIGLFKTVDYEAERENHGQETRDLLRQWKQDRAWLLQRFDLNRDGQIDPAEWELARKAAKKQIDFEHQDLQKRPTTHLMVASDSPRHPFLISTLPQFDLVKRYRLRAGGAITLFFVAGVIAIWMLNNRLFQS